MKRWIWVFLAVLLAVPQLTHAAVVLSERDWQALKRQARSHGPAFPTAPVTNDLFLLTDDSAVGACDSAGGIGAVTLCRWDGATWVAVAGAVGGVATLDEAFDGGKAIDSANSATNAFRVLDANGDGTAIYTDATDGPVIACVENNTVNGCTAYARKLASGQSVVTKNSAGTAISTLTESTGAYTNVTLDAEATGNTITLTDEQWWDVAACQNATAQLVWNVPTANSPAATCDTGTNTQKGYAAFDAATDESFEMDWLLPTGFTGAIDIHFIWKAAATSGATGWCAQLIRVADGSTSDPAYPAQAAGNCVSDTAKGIALQENHATITGVTCTSCAARDHVYVRISRDANGGAVTDDMTGDALLMKVGRTIRIAK